jgi:hypothetical protein
MKRQLHKPYHLPSSEPNAVGAEWGHWPHSKQAKTLLHTRKIRWGPLIWDAMSVKVVYGHLNEEQIITSMPA